MLDETAKRPDLKSKTMAELYKKRVKDRPDDWTLAWWKQQLAEVEEGYIGACHAINLSVAKSRAIQDKMKDCEERMVVMEARHDELLAQLGEMQAENVILAKRVEEMANWATKVQKQLPKSGD